jgi:hypothetical protein
MLVLCDEPLSNLDADLRERMRDTSMAAYVEVEPAGDAGREPAGPGRQAGGRPFRARHPGGPLAAGTGLLLVRPTGVQICPADDAGRHLTGTVADVAFRGRGYDHAIDVPGQGRLTGVFSPARGGRGERVGLRFDPDGCHVFAPPEPGRQILAARSGRWRMGRAPRPGRRRRRTKGYLTVTHRSPFIPFSAA